MEFKDVLKWGLFGVLGNAKDDVEDFVLNIVEKNNKKIDDAQETRERLNLSAKSTSDLKEMYQKTDSQRLKNAIRIELSERNS